MEFLNELLQLPQHALLQRKIPKTFFGKNFMLSAAERNLLEDGDPVRALHWYASIGPESNVPAWASPRQIYEEIQVIAVQTAVHITASQQRQTIDLVQRHIPYHLLLCLYTDEHFLLHTCDKLLLPQEQSRRGTGTGWLTEPMPLQAVNPHQQAFRAGLAYGRLDKTSLKTLYDSYARHIVALRAAALRDRYRLQDPERSREDWQHLEEIAHSEAELERLAAAAQKETQMNGRVLINKELQQLRRHIEQLKERIIHA